MAPEGPVGRSSDPLARCSELEEMIDEFHLMGYGSNDLELLRADVERATQARSPMPETLSALEARLRVFAGRLMMGSIQNAELHLAALLQLGPLTPAVRQLADRIPLLRVAMESGGSDYAAALSEAVGLEEALRQLRSREGAAPYV